MQLNRRDFATSVAGTLLFGLSTDISVSAKTKEPILSPQTEWVSHPVFQRFEVLETKIVEFPLEFVNNNLAKAQYTRHYCKDSKIERLVDGDVVGVPLYPIDSYSKYIDGCNDVLLASGYENDYVGCSAFEGQNILSNTLFSRIDYIFYKKNRKLTDLIIDDSTKLFKHLANSISHLSIRIHRMNIRNRVLSLQDRGILPKGEYRLLLGIDASRHSFVNPFNGNLNGIASLDKNDILLGRI